MDLETVKTYNVQIWVGFKEQYDGLVHTIEELKKICQDYVNDIKPCVTLNPTEFIYTGGNEPGALIGLIQYSRFHREESEIVSIAINLANKIMEMFGQFRVSIITPEMTYMLKNSKLIK